MKPIFTKVNSKDNINDYVNFEKLRKSNDLLKKWHTRFKIKKSGFMQFMQNMRKNPQFYINKLEQQYKSAFSKDHKTMFYASEVENILLEQYYPMLINIIKKLHIEECHFDDCLTHGLLSIRNSVWQFRSHERKASFFTFCYNGAYIGILGKKFNLTKKTKIQNNIKTINESDIYNPQQNGNFLQTIICKSSNPHEIYEKLFTNDIKTLLKECDLNSQELEIINRYINRYSETGTGRCKWLNEYRKQFPKADGKIMSKQAVHQKLARIQRKIWNVYRTLSERKSTRDS